MFWFCNIQLSDSDPYDQDINQIPYSKGTDELRDTSYAFQYSRLTSDGHQAQISYERRYYRPSSNSLEGNQHNQFTPGPNYFNPQLPTNMTTVHRDPFITSPPHTRNHFHGPEYITEHSRYIYILLYPSLNFMAKESE